MDMIIDFFKDLWDQILVIITTVNNPVFDILDILIVTFIIYKAVQFMRETRAEQLIKGILIFVLAYFAANFLNLRALLWFMDLVYANAIVVVIILFQPELRSALERIGRGNIRNLGRSLTLEESSVRISNMIDAVCKACQSMQKDKVGALIVIEQKTMLGEIAATGTVMDARASRDLICNVFYPKSPLHDGAMIIRSDRLYAAGCILPLTQNKEIDSELGTRHRAAIGVSEVSDALVVVVSEETGTISVMKNGNIQRGYDPVTLKNELTSVLVGSEEDGSERSFKKFFKRAGGKKHEKN